MNYVLLTNINQSRVDFVSELTRWNRDYGNISLQEWNVPSRVFFHEMMYGTDDVSGIIGVLGNTNGLAKKLNDVLYGFQTYVIEVVKNQTNGRTVLNHSSFQADLNDNYNSAYNFISYSNLDFNSITVQTSVYTYIESLQGKTSNLIDIENRMNSSLLRLLQQEWSDDYIRELESVITS